MNMSAGAIRSLATAAVVIALDQATKSWAVARLADAPCSSAPDACIDVAWTLRFHYVGNPGASFSSFTSGGPVLGVIALVMTVFLLYQGGRSTDRLASTLYGLVAGGALGNVLDRIFRAEDGFLSGEVVDFIDFQWWPIFNIADMAVIGGAVALAAQIWRVDRTAALAEAEAQGEADSSNDADSIKEAASSDDADDEPADSMSAASSDTADEQGTVDD